jgi:pyridoxal phosphate enzyme (YggS family)
LIVLEINKQAEKNGRVIDCLLQVHIAQEESKFGFDRIELQKAAVEINNSSLVNVSVKGLMGIASFTDDMEKVRSEFRDLKTFFALAHPGFTILSMGMSNDYHIAIEEGSTMVRIGSLLFGERTPPQ